MPIQPAPQPWTIVTMPDEDTLRENCPSHYDPAPDRERVLCLRSKGHRGAHVGVDNGFQVQWS